ncbi:MAG TPA: DnaB-like helicase C-terminal domain-containing protein [Pyrinomonadaceae bacterium]|nr:DnaB-like helicase C-terminal domain-containing protein [Pyrinomonadaceae bacterium]
MNLKRHEEHIIGGLFKGVIATTDIKIGVADFAEYGKLFGIIRQIEADGAGIPDAETVYAAASALDDFSWHSVEDFRRMAEAPISASSAIAAAAALRSSSLKEDLTTRAANLFANPERLSGGEMLTQMKAICAEAEAEYSEVRGGFKWLKELTPKVGKVYEDLYNGISYTVPTGFKGIDEAILDGFSKADLHLIVGMTGSGKTALALNFARNQAKTGLPVGIVSREMSDIENIIRLQVAETKTPRWYIRKGLHEYDYKKLTENLTALGELPILINTETVNVEDLRPQVRQLVDEHGLGIFYVDYLQLMKSNGNQARRDLEIAAVSRTLKEIAMENNIPVVALCQFNRGAINASVFEIMHHLKESSGLEQDASTIIFIEVEQTQEKKDVKTAKTTVLKNRNGAPFVETPLNYKGDVFTFSEITNEQNIQAHDF